MPETVHELYGWSRNASSLSDDVSEVRSGKGKMEGKDESIGTKDGLRESFCRKGTKISMRRTVDYVFDVVKKGLFGTNMMKTYTSRK